MRKEDPSEAIVTVDGVKKWIIALTVAGLVLFAVLAFLGFSRVDVTLMGRETSCGTGFSPGWSDDMLTGTVCGALMGERHLSMMFVALPGVCLLLLAAVGAKKRKRGPTQSDRRSNLSAA